ncbi:MAG: alternate-type signal peptide domain-containing protein [Microbacterium sp.]|uniref:alternate-type signal peptide domain-containing protein n=1 Tax=Microbacterium sp. TaxID=51671 RepID=UPI00271B58B5|nr:alternate-type signal peptide domain-containing protein [Microbacterium sp.]MDO8384607.1 alternate-type signal peptide domain-containing protein [Microbacterium sp.]
MNKVVKGTIAAASAVALFGGGAGSLAYWQATANTDGLLLQMGHVEMYRTGAAGYAFNDESVSADTLEGGTWLVPGDVVAYSQSYQIDVRGTDAVLRVPELDFTGTPDYVLEAIETTLEVIPNGAYSQFSATNEARAFNVTGYGSFTVRITIEVPEELEDDEPMVDPINLTELQLTLTQVAEPLPDAVG